MAKGRKKNTRDTGEESGFSLSNFISRETTNGILSIFSVLIAIFLLLGAFGLSGQAGTFVYEWLSTYLFGIGYYILPVVAILLALSFLKDHERSFATPQIVGSLILFLSALGFIDLVSSRGGNVGGIISSPLMSLFGTYFSAVVFIALITVSILVISNAAIKFDLFTFIKNVFSKKALDEALAPVELPAPQKTL